MQHESFIPSSPGSRLIHLAAVCAIAVLCFTHTALGQSGRQRRKSEPPPSPAQPKPDPSLEEPSRLVPVSSIIVTGYVVHDFKYYRSKDVSEASDACIKTLREHLGLDIIKGGKLKREEAIAWAKKETSAYVLWLEIGIWKPYSYSTAVSYINYYLFMPQTGEVLTKGQYDPYKRVARINGMPIPGTRVPAIQSLQLEDGGQQIAAHIIRLLKASTDSN